MLHGKRFRLGLALSCSLLASPCAAQDPNAAETPPSEWSASVSAGLALTAGNTNTSTVNVAFDALRDGRRFVFRAAGLLLRGDQEDRLSVDRRSLETRLDLRLTEQMSVFGQTSYLRDRFKAIDYLVAPTLGLAYRPRNTPRLDVLVDTSVGTVFEKNDGRVRTSAALAAGERLVLGVGESARITQSFRALWKIEDFGDALYTFGVGIAASVTARSELRAELIDTFKNEPPASNLLRNDVSVLVSIVYKF